MWLVKKFLLVSPTNIERPKEQRKISHGFYEIQITFGLMSMDAYNAEHLSPFSSCSSLFPDLSMHFEYSKLAVTIFPILCVRAVISACLILYRPNSALFVQRDKQAK